MRTVLLLAAGLLLAACVTAPPRPRLAPENYAARRPLLQAVARFELEGRLAAAVGEEGVNASLTWHQQGRRSELQLRAPLGFGSAQVTREGDEIHLVSSRGEQLSGNLASEELARRLGFAPPLDSLRYWVLGVPDPARPAAETLVSGSQLSVLEQDGWRVEYPEYRRFGTGPLEGLLPRRLTLLRDDIRLKLIVERWHVVGP
jgi:outer membrane lipoprotein LolB